MQGGLGLNKDKSLERLLSTGAKVLGTDSPLIPTAIL
jgi:hypothetical protein